jgi:hypothetical protein
VDGMRKRVIGLSNGIIVNDVDEGTYDDVYLY